MLKWLLWIASVPLAAGILVYAVGAMLKPDHVARGEAMIAAPTDEIADIVRSVERQPQWRSGVAAVEVLERGRGRLRYLERSGGGAITFDFAEEVEGRHFRSTIADPELPFGGFWTIVLEPEGQGTRVLIEEHGTVRSPVYRFFSALVFGHEGTLKTYLADLQKAAEGATARAARPEPSA